MKQIIFRLGWIFTMTYSITITFTFLNAFFNGYQTLVTINTFGEAKAEFIMLIISIPCIVYFALESFKLHINKEKLKND